MTKVISVENMSKKYIIAHEKQIGSSNLRDTITDSITKLGRSKGPKTKSLEEFWALNDVSFDIIAGERVGIIGGNGAGKSTLLKILSRITEPTKGSIKIRGRVASLLEVGTGFHQELTGRENIFLNGAILGMSRSEIRKKFDEIVEFAEIEKFLDTPVKRYSSGMYVRLAFSVAAHLESEVLILDEVLAVGDARFQKKCMGKMEDVGKQGRTILFVSHNAVAVRTLCNRAIWLDKGKVIVDDSVDEAVSKYLSNNVADNMLCRRWEDEAVAPHNSSSVIKSIRVCDDSGMNLGSVYTDTPFNIEIEYIVKQEGVSVGFTAILYNNEGTCVFSSISNLEKEWYGKAMPTGTFKSVCKIPKNFLNNGSYLLTINQFAYNYSDLVSSPEVLKIEVLDGLAVRGDYKFGFGGVVRPMLTWETEKI
jgi:lipopolysaccharide transport system ATP-binding protein